MVALVCNAHARGEHPQDPRNPSRYTLGPGHVRFFYPRMKYIIDRYRELIDECQYRGRKVSYPTLPAALRSLPVEWFGDWRPDDEALRINRARLRERGGSCGGWEDYQYKCHHCGHTWRVEGIDA